MRNRNYSDNRSTKTRRKKKQQATLSDETAEWRNNCVWMCIWWTSTSFYLGSRSAVCVRGESRKARKKFLYLFWFSRFVRKRSEYKHKKNSNDGASHYIERTTRAEARTERKKTRKIRCIADVRIFFFCCCFTLHNSEERRPAAAIPRCQLFHRKQKCASTRCNVDASQNVIY